MGGEIFTSDALVDYSGLSKTVADIQRGFSLVEFLDACALVEGIVLHDRLLVVGGDLLFPAKAEQSRLGALAEPLHPLVDAGVLHIAPKTGPARFMGPRPEHEEGEHGHNADAAFWRQHERVITRSTELDSWYESGRLLGAEEALRCSALALIRQRPHYEPAVRAKADHTVCDLFGRYKDMRTSLEALRRVSRLPYEPYFAVPIPPLPLLALKACSSPEDLIPRALAVRDDFSKLRASLRQLREDLADETTPPKKKLAAIRSWKRSWATLDHDQASIIELGNSALDAADLNKATEELGLDSVSLSKVIQLALNATVQRLYRWRVRLLHRVAKSYLSTPDSDLNRQVERLFGTQVTHAQLQAVSALRGID